MNNARVEGAAELGHDTESDKTYVVLQVPAVKELSQVLKLEEGLRRQYGFDALESRALRSFAISAAQPRQRNLLKRSADLLSFAERRRGALPKRRAELEQVLVDVARVRENARILGGVRVRQVESMAQRMLELEAQVVQLRTRIAELTSDAEGFARAAKQELNQL